MTKTTKLSEYKKGYDLITDDELNGLFVAHVEDLKDQILKDQKMGGSYYLVSSVDYNDKKIKLYRDVYAIKNTDENITSPEKLANVAAKFADQFCRSHSSRTVVMLIYCLVAKFTRDNGELITGILASSQTADGRCCMSLHKVIFDGNDKIVGFEAIEEHIPKKHTNDEEYIWEGSVNFFERVAKVNKITNHNES